MHLSDQCAASELCLQKLADCTICFRDKQEVVGRNSYCPFCQYHLSQKLIITVLSFRSVSDKLADLQY